MFRRHFKPAKQSICDPAPTSLWDYSEPEELKTLFGYAEPHTTNRSSRLSKLAYSHADAVSAHAVLNLLRGFK